VYGPIDQLFSGGNSNYNSLQAELAKRLSKGLMLHASYTYSHSLDDTSGFENSSFGTFGNNFGGYGGATRAANPYCYFSGCDYGSSVFDAQQRLVISYSYQIPGLHSNGFVSRITNGWTVTGIATFQTGFPQDVADLSSPSGGCNGGGDFSCWEGPNQVAPVKYMNPRTTGYWFDPSSFVEVTCPVPHAPGTPPPPPNCPEAGVNPTSVAAYGNAPRNPIRGPGINDWDVTLYKDTTITERTKLELRFEAYNVFNHTQFSPAGINGDASNLFESTPTTTAFGTISATYPARRMQIAARLTF
jgi:hypothetical protein